MNVYSKELEILDRNTVLYMIDEMQEEIERKDLEFAQAMKQKDLELERSAQTIEQNAQVIKQKDQALAQKDDALLRKQQEILELKSRIAALQEAFQE